MDCTLNDIKFSTTRRGGTQTLNPNPNFLSRSSSYPICLLTKYFENLHVGYYRP